MSTSVHFKLKRVSFFQISFFLFLNLFFLATSKPLFAWVRIPGTNIILFQEGGIGATEVTVIVIIIAIIWVAGAIGKKLREEKIQKERTDEINHLQNIVRNLEDKLEKSRNSPDEKDNIIQKETSPRET